MQLKLVLPMCLFVLYRPTPWFHNTNIGSFIAAGDKNNVIQDLRPPECTVPEGFQIVYVLINGYDFIRFIKAPPHGLIRGDFCCRQHPLPGNKSWGIADGETVCICQEFKLSQLQMLKAPVRGLVMQCIVKYLTVFVVTVPSIKQYYNILTPARPVCNP